MKLKYYLNGFGIGVLFATIILSVAFLVRSSGSQMTDEEVMARARALGMEMVSSEKESEETTTISREKETTTRAQEQTTSEEAESSNEETETTVESETTSELETTTEVETTTEPPTTTATELATTAQQTGEPERIAFEIVSGMTSESVAELLEEKGVISDAKEFNAYVVEQGYAGSIRTGNYEIVPDAAYDEIINFICR